MKKTLPLLSLMIALGACDKEPEYILNQDVFCGYRQELTCKDMKVFCKDKTEVFVCIDMDGNAVSGHVVGFYPDGVKQEDFSVKNGLAVGKHKSFWPNGNLSSQGNFRNGKLNGIVKDYRSDGNLNEVTEYKNGISGDSYALHENGKTAIKFKTKNGKWLNVKKYDEQGRLTEEHIYNDNKATYKYYDENGLLKKADYFDKGLVGEESYVNGKLDGIRKSYYDDKKTVVEYEESWKDGQLNGIKKHYDKDGVLDHETNYDKGLRNGYDREYFSDGSLRYEQFFIYDASHGTRKSFRSPGKLLHEMTHKYGIPDGVERYYSEDGEITEERVYKDGKLIKETK